MQKENFSLHLQTHWVNGLVNNYQKQVKNVYIRDASFLKIIANCMKLQKYLLTIFGGLPHATLGPF